MKRIEDMSLEELADWVCKTCLMFGAHPVTAYKVASVFIEGLQKPYDSTEK